MAVDLDATAVCLDDLAGDGEPQARPPSLGGVEGLEHARQALGRDARTVVADGHRDVCSGARVQRRVDDDTTAGTESVYRVLQDSEQRLLKMDGIGLDLRKLRSERLDEGDPCAGGARRDQG